LVIYDQSDAPIFGLSERCRSNGMCRAPRSFQQAARATGGRRSVDGRWFFRPTKKQGPVRAAEAASHADLKRQEETIMRRELAALLVSGALIAAGGTAKAHHSFAMFDQENPIELEGVVQEFK